MPELRWILIAFAVVLLAGIYFWGRRAGRGVASDDALVRIRPEPALHPDMHEQTDFDREPLVVDSGLSEEPYLPEEPEPDTFAAASYPSTYEPSKTGSHTRAPGSTGDTWRGRVEPTFSEYGATEELPVDPPPQSRPEPAREWRAETDAQPPAPAYEEPRHPSPEPARVASTTEDKPAPTLSSSDAPAPRRIERRKVLALRLACTPHKVEGARLLEAFAAEHLEHGKYDVFHRLHSDGAIIFSAASMVEPGTFDPATMPDTQYPGVTLFAQLPGPVPGMHALNELVACARRLQQSLGGTLQDERGVPLTVHRIERMRQEVREFERPPPSSTGTRPPSRPAHFD